MNLVQRIVLSAVCALGIAAPAMQAHARGVGGDEVIYWNNVLLDEFRQFYGTGCPCPLGRAGAIVQAAVYEAVNSIDREYEPYIDFVEADKDASKEAAVAAAAYRTMMSLFPESAPLLNNHYTIRKGLIGNSKAKNDGIRAGNAAARQILEARVNDGSQLEQTYTFGTNPGDYQPVPPAFSPRGCDPQWTRVTPFCADSNTQFRPRGPLGFKVMSKLLASRGYADQVNEVKRLGRRFGSDRTDEQTQIAFFWANDANGTYKPPGHLFSITQTVSQDQNLSLEENARLFALVGLGMGDAALVAWDAKWATAIDLWRPVTAIRRASTDGNPLTVEEKSWLPLNSFTPPFAAYISGHATFGAVHAAIMMDFFGTDNITFTVDSQDPFYAQLPNHPPRTFTSFSQAAIENGLSRVYLGVHYRMDAADGNAAGFALGHHVSQNFLKKRCIADFNGDKIFNNFDMYDFYDAYSADDSSADVDNSGTVNEEDMFKFMDAYMSGC